MTIPIPKIGTGIVEISDSYITMYSFVHSVNINKSIICEYLAILDTLKIIKYNHHLSKAVIYTDQESLGKNLSALNEQLKKGEFKEYYEEFEELFTQLNEEVSLEYVGKLKNNKKNLIYKKADSLSRKYKDEIIDSLN